MITNESIAGLIADYLAGNGLFLVDIDISRENDIVVTIESYDGSVTLDNCTAIDSIVTGHFDKDAEDYSLTVTSAGLDQPFKVAQQYIKFTGSEVEITLKKGGRITPAAAAIGTVLNLKPVLQIQGEKLDAFAKVRGWKAAKKTMLNAIEKDLNGRFADVKDQMVLGMAYTCSKEDAQEWKQEIMDRFPGYEILEGPLSLSVACHIGPGAMAVTCMKKV